MHMKALPSFGERRETHHAERLACPQRQRLRQSSSGCGRAPRSQFLGLATCTPRLPPLDHRTLTCSRLCTFGLSVQVKPHAGCRGRRHTAGLFACRWRQQSCGPEAAAPARDAEVGVLPSMPSMLAVDSLGLVGPHLLRVRPGHCTSCHLHVGCSVSRCSQSFHEMCSSKTAA